jgi:hypothetical protein
MRIAVSPADFDRWTELLALLRQAFAYMDSRIDPPSSLQRMSIVDLQYKAREESLSFLNCRSESS